MSQIPPSWTRRLESRVHADTRRDWEIDARREFPPRIVRLCADGKRKSHELFNRVSFLHTRATRHAIEAFKYVCVR